MLPDDLAWIFIVPNADKGCVPEVPIRRPFTDAYLRDELGLEPAA